MFDMENIPVLRASRNLPQAVIDAQPVLSRGDRYGAAHVSNVYPDMAAAAEEGAYFTVNNAQTGIATAATPVSFSATNPFLIVYNRETASNPAAKRIILDYAMLLPTAAGTAGANVQFAVTLDSGNRYSSGGTELTTLIVNPNGDASGTSVAKVYAGNLTATAASALVRTVVGQRYMKGAIPVIGDTYTIKFGGVDAPSFIGISTILTSVNNVPKVVIPPGWSAIVHLWLTSQSAASSYAPELGWVER